MKEQALSYQVTALRERWGMGGDPFHPPRSGRKDEHICYEASTINTEVL